MLRGRRSIQPMHGRRKEMKTGTGGRDQEAARRSMRKQCAPIATLTPDPDGGFTVTFRDVPEAITEATAAKKRCCAPKMRSNRRSRCM